MTGTTFKESDLKFNFSSDWWVVQYDDLTDYNKLKNTVEGSKAVDFIGILRNKTLVFFEIKNFRGHRIENKPRLSAGDDPLELEIAQKVRDTLAGMTAAARNSTHLRHEWQRVLSFLQDEGINVEIVLWLEEDTPPQYDTLLKRKVQAIGGTLSRRIKQRLSWLTSRVFVCSISENKYAENIDVAFL
jgi:hypothetical protein